MVANRLLLVVTATILSHTIAFADAPELTISVEVQREVLAKDDRGRPVVALEPVDRAQPGEVLVYTLRAVNRGPGSALGARIVDPIPPGTVLLLSEVAGNDRPTRASIDGGRSWQDFPARVQQLDASGRPRLVAAPAEAYTHLRWDLPVPLAPGETHEVMFKVRVN